MVIRPAKMGDLPAVFDLMAEMHARSKYADQGIGMEPVAAKALLMQSIQRHGGGNDGSTYFVVAEEDGKITAFMIGILQRCYLICDRLEAMDVFLYASKDAGARIAPMLIDSYARWADACTKVASIKISYTDALGVDGGALGRLYTRKGFTQHGAIFERIKSA